MIGLNVELSKKGTIGLVAASSSNAMLEKYGFMDWKSIPNESYMLLELPSAEACTYYFRL